MGDSSGRERGPLNDEDRNTRAQPMRTCEVKISRSIIEGGRDGCPDLHITHPDIDEEMVKMMISTFCTMSLDQRPDHMVRASSFFDPLKEVSR